MNSRNLALIAVLCSAPAFADEVEVTNRPESEAANAAGAPTKKPMANHVTPTGIVPRNLLFPYYALYSQDIKERYQKNGQRESLLGLNVKAKANVMGALYGITDSSTITLSVPYITHSEAKIHSYEKLRTSKEYAAVQGYTSSLLTDGFVQAGLCADVAACKTQIANGMTFPVSDAAAGYSAGMPVESYITSASDSYFRDHAQSEGTQAMGDMKIGLNNQYFQNGSWTIKSRSELTIPTGKYDVEEGKNPTGDGRYSMEVFGNAEYALHRGALVVLEQGMSYDLTSAEADGVKSRYEGIGQKSGLYLLFDPGQFIEPLKFVAFSTSYNIATKPSRSQKSSTAGDLGNLPQSSIDYHTNTVRFSGFNYQLPMFVDLIKETPIAGKNINATEKNTIVVATVAPL